MLQLQIDGPIAHLELSRPEKLNAMNWEFWTQLPRCMEEVDAQEEVRVLILSGAGRAFSVGLDLLDMGPRLELQSAGPDGQQQRRLHQLIRRLQESIRSVERCRVPVIAAVHGYCLGGAMDLITACDLRLASEDALFSVRETKIAMVADLGTLQRLPRILPEGIAREWIYTGRDVPAPEALQAGLLNRLLPSREATMEAARELAQSIAANPPLAVQGSKQVLTERHRADVDRELEYVATWNTAHLKTRDLLTAMAAFMARETPEFEGR